jgi:hypothetical protein
VLTDGLTAAATPQRRHCDRPDPLCHQEVPQRTDPGLNIHQRRARTSHKLSGMESHTLQSALALLFAHEGLQPEPIGDNLVRIPVPTADGPIRVTVLLNPEAGAAAMYTMHPDRVSEARRVEAAVLLTQFNYGLMAGALELDDEDGELRVRTGVDFGGGPITVEALSRAMELNLGLREAATPLFASLCTQPS